MEKILLNRAGVIEYPCRKNDTWLYFLPELNVKNKILFFFLLFYTA